MDNITFKRRPLIIRIWWKIINLIIRKRPTNLDGEDDFNNLIKENSNDKRKIYNHRDEP